MKGQVHIIIKDKDGNVTNDITQENKIFDVPRIILNEMLPVTLQNMYKYSITNSNTMGSITFNSLFLSNITRVKDWFLGIKLNDEFIKTNEDGTIAEDAYKDWKIPQLYASSNASLSDSNNTRYTYNNSNFGFESNNVKKVYYNWGNVPETFMLKSINLCHYDAIGRNSNYWVNHIGCSANRYGDQRLMYKYGKFYFGRTSNLSNVGDRYCGDLLYDPYFSFTNDRVQFNGAITGTYSGAIFPLYNNEIALLTNGTETINPRPSYSDAYKGISIIDANTGELKRWFSFYQLVGCGQSGYTSSDTQTIINCYSAISWQYINIISTPTGNYLLVYTPFTARTAYTSSNYLTRRVYLYKIPDEQIEQCVPAVGDRTADRTVVEGKKYYTYTGSSASANIKPGYLVDKLGGRFVEVANPTGNPYNNGYYELSEIGSNGFRIEPIELPTELANSGDSSRVMSSYPINNNLMCGEYILTFKENNVIDIIKRKICNCGNSLLNAKTYDLNYVGRTCIPGFSYGLGYNEVNPNYPVWYNTSALNLATPVEVTAGSALTVEYTITAN